MKRRTHLKARQERKRASLTADMFMISDSLRSGKQSLEAAIASIAEAVGFLLEGK